MSIRSDGKLPKLACYIVLCLVVCIHHSHQENNLSRDRIKGEEQAQYAKNINENPNASLAIEEKHGRFLFKYVVLYEMWKCIQ